MRLENLTFSRGLWWSFLQGHGTVFKQSHKHREKVACMVYYCIAHRTDIQKTRSRVYMLYTQFPLANALNFSLFLHWTLQKTFHCQQLLTHSALLCILYKYTLISTRDSKIPLFQWTDLLNKCIKLLTYMEERMPINVSVSHHRVYVHSHV